VPAIAVALLGFRFFTHESHAPGEGCDVACTLGGREVFALVLYFLQRIGIESEGFEFAKVTHVRALGPELITSHGRVLGLGLAGPILAGALVLAAATAEALKLLVGGVPVLVVTLAKLLEILEHVRHRRRITSTLAISCPGITAGSALSTTTTATRGRVDFRCLE
jgi:hypothetical protein